MPSLRSQLQKHVLLYPADGFSMLETGGVLAVFQSANTLRGRDLYSVKIKGHGTGVKSRDFGHQFSGSTNQDAPGRPQTVFLLGGKDVIDEEWEKSAKGLVLDVLRVEGRVVVTGNNLKLLRTLAVAPAQANILSQLLETEDQQNTPTQAFIEQGCFFHTQGLSAVIDVALRLVELDHGTMLALEIAACLGLPIRRTAEFPRLSSGLRAQISVLPRLQTLISKVAQFPQDDWTIEKMAQEVNLAPRSLHRHFLVQTKMTPSKFVEHMRIELAMTLLDSGRESLDQVARLSGLGDAQNLRRIHARYFGVTPSRTKKARRMTEKYRHVTTTTVKGDKCYG